MKIVVSKEELLSKLSTIQNIVEKKNTMPILSHFLLDAGKQGSSIAATDLDTALREPLNLTVEKEGRICIPARKMFEIVREVEGELSLETVDDHWLKMKAGAGSFRLACLSAKEFPAWPGMEDMQELTMKSAVLVEAIEKTVYAAGETDTRYTLNGLLFHFQEGRVTVVGTDGHRLALLVREITGAVKEEQKLIIPRKASTELRKLLDKREDDVRLAIGQNHVLFSVGDVQFLTRLIEGTYPNYEQVIPSNNDKKAVVSRDLLARTIRRVAIMSKESQTRGVKVDIADNVMKVSSFNPDLGEANDEIAIDYTGEALALGFNAKYLLDILEVMDSEKVVLEMQAQLSPVLVREEKDEQYRCVIMPMRI